MNAIAANPDYLRTGPSRTMDQGAPVVFGDLPKGALLGRAETVADGSGNRVRVRYVVVDAGSVLPSNAADGTPSMGYAEGVPGKLRAVAGNARAAGLIGAFNRGTAKTYQRELMNDAQTLGIDPRPLAQMQRPMLVRLMDEADITPDMGDRTNIQAGAAMSAVEQAANDVRRVDVASLQFDDAGNPTRETMAAFINQMPVSERGAMLDRDGTPTRQAIDRLLAAAFKQAYDNDALVALASQATDPQARTVISALASVAGDMAQLAGTGEYDIRAVVSEAAQKAVNARRRGLPLQKVLQERDLQDTPEMLVVAQFMADNIRSAKRMADGLRAWASLAQAQVQTARENERSAGLFGETPVLGRERIFERLGNGGQTESAQRGGSESAAQDTGRQNAPEREREAGSAQDGRAGRAEQQERAGEANKVESNDALVARENEASYETDLFGDPVPAPARRAVRAQSTRTGLRGNVQPAAEIRDTQTPEGQYFVRTIVGHETQRRLGADLIRTPQDAAQATAYLYKSAVERFDAIVTDKGGKPLAVVGGFKGAISQTAVYPGTVVAEAVRVPGAAHVWFSHNHPSGNSMLSRADEALAHVLGDAFRGSGIEPMGLMAVSNGKFSFLHTNGTTVDAQSIPAIPTAARTTVPVVERELAKSEAAPPIDSPAAALRIGREFHEQGGDGILLLNAQHAVSAWVPITDQMRGTLRHTGALNAIYRAISESNASAAILVHDGALDASHPDSRAVTVGNNIAAALAKVDVRPLDIINVKNGASVAQSGMPVASGPMFSRSAPVEQTQTPEFQRWFGDSKVVDAEGKPLVVYHGTGWDFTAFSVDKLGSNTGAASAKRGFFFASNPKVSDFYARMAFKDLAAAIKQEWDQVFQDKPAGGKWVGGYEGDFVLESDPAAGRAYKERVLKARSAFQKLGDQEQRYRKLNRRAADIAHEVLEDYGIHIVDAKDAGAKFLDDNPYFAKLMQEYAEVERARTDLMLEIGYMNGANVMPAYLKISNPLEHDFDGERFRDVTYNQLIKQAQDEGRDGVILRNTFDTSDHPMDRPLTDVYVVFEPTQIKSATGNNGNFDPTNPDIRYSRSARTKADYEARIDALFSGGKAATGTRVLDRSDVMGMLGHPDMPLILDESHLVSEGLDAHPEMTAAQWKKVPEWIENPALAYKSRGRIVLAAPERVAGHPVLMVIDPEGHATGGRGQANVQLLVTAYAKTRGGVPFGEIEREKSLIYWNTQNAPAMRGSGGVQFSTRAYTELGRGRILTEKNLAGYRRENNPAYSQSMFPELANQLLDLHPKPATKESVHAALSELVNGVGRLPNGLGRVVVATAAEIKSTWEPLVGRADIEASGEIGKAQGFYDPKTKTVFLIADHIRQGDELGVVAHELMHKHGQAVLGEDGWNKLHSVITGWANAPEGSRERRVYREAAARVRASRPEGVEGQGYSSQELFPYAVQVALELGIKPSMTIAPGKVARWLAEVKAALREAWNKITYGKAGFQSQDLVNLAFGIAQRENPAHAAELEEIRTGRTELAAVSPPGRDDGPIFSRASSQQLSLQPRQMSVLTRTQQKVRELIDVDKWLYNWQDKFIDLKRIQATIKELNGTVTEVNDAYRGEELYHKRVAARTRNFLRDEVRPLLAAMNDAKVTMQEFDRFLHARHAPEANKAMAERNLSQKELDAKRAAADKTVDDLRLQLQKSQANGSSVAPIQKALAKAMIEADEWRGAQPFKGTEAQRLSLSGMSDAEAKAILDGYTPVKRQAMDALAKQVDRINAGTLRTLEDYGLMNATALDAWRKQYQFYVPLHRDEAHQDSRAHPIGQGFSTRGSAAKGRVGSNEKVTNILAHVMMQREAALTRGEKNNVVKRLYLLASQNPDESLWSLKLPMKKGVDPDTGLVRSMVDQAAKLRDNVVTVRIGGVDKYIVFNERNEQATRLALAMKNMDAMELDRFTRSMARMTRILAAMSTQYNPVFGVVNVIRDLQATMLQLTNTPLAGKQGEVLKNVAANVRDVYRDLRAERKGGAVGQTAWARLWEQMQLDGGTTGYRDLYTEPENRVKALQAELDQMGHKGKAREVAMGIKNWLSDWNETLENTTRLAVYKAALDQGISRQEAASIAKNITVNFNRRGRNAAVAGSYFAFFNAAIQGTARMAETLAGPAGKKVITGGVALGMLSAMAGMMMMGGDDDEWGKIPEFIKERSIIIPLSHEDYVAIPMPLGFHVFPNIGRKIVEIATHDDPTTSRLKYLGDLAMSAIDAFSPVGGADDVGQMVTPTPFDPVIALWRNKDWTGKSIYREPRSSLDPTPGHARAKDSATQPSRWVSRVINAATGGNEWRPGALSPSPDAIDYLFGQLTGGVGRELVKLGKMVASAATGEELAPHQIVVAGRFYGNTRGANGQSERYYENLKRLNEDMAEAKGRVGEGEDADAVLADLPLAPLAGPAKQVDKRISDLRKYRRQIQASDDTDRMEKVKAINREIEDLMARLNRAVRQELKSGSE